MRYRWVDAMGLSGCLQSVLQALRWFTGGASPSADAGFIAFLWVTAIRASGRDAPITTKG